MAFPVLVAALALAVSLPAAAVTPARKPASAPTVPLADTSPSRLPAAGPLELLAVFEQQFGRHPGLRKGHARGFCASGEFHPAPEARAFAVTPWLAGPALPVLARFSMAGGNPAAHEASRSPRGLGLQFRLPDGGVHQMALLSTPVFGARDPDTFLGLLRAQLPDPATGKPDPARVEAFRVAHPDTRAQAAWLAANAPPWSYATTAYHGIHAFLLQRPDGEWQAVRFRFEPLDGVRGLTAEEVKASPPAFLQARLRERLADGPVRFRLLASLAEPGDPLDDPSRAWPVGREERVLGELRVTAAEAADGGACVGVNFDPNVLAPGVRPSDDPVLRIRSAAYAVSFGRRLQGQ
jgi:catalase